MALQDLVDESAEIARMFPELHPAMSKQEAVVEADRCLNCFDAPCTSACPTHIDVPRFIKKIASGNLRGSAQSILDANVMALSCARVCPVEVLCEGSCVMHGYSKKPIEIGRLQRYAMDAFHAGGGKLKRAEVERPERVACVGAGPASLAAAAALRQRGFQVAVFDRRPLAGGLNTFGVAEYKLRPADSLREIALIAELGVEFRFETAVRDVTELEDQFDLIFLGMGLGAMHRLEIPGGDSPAVVDALRFIEDYKMERVTGIRGSVVVVGAGNTAIDAAIAAKRLGADEVSILYRRTEGDISAFGFEYAHAKQEGVRFVWSTQPVEVRADSPGVVAVVCVKTESASDGRLVQVAGSEFEVVCNVVIPAIGQAPLEILAERCGFEVSGGRVVVDRATGRTANPKYFAGGDCVNGGREVVDAVADGKRAGMAMAGVLEEAYA